MDSETLLTGAGPLLALAIVLVAGVTSGWVARRLHLPAVTGQILAGIALGAAGFRILDLDTVEGLEPITHFALGLIAVTIGDHLNLRRLRGAFRRLSYLLLLEATLTPVVVFAVLRLLPGSSGPLAALLAALAVSTAPATIVAIVRETRSKGVFVKTLVAAVALNNIACICLFEMAHSAAQVVMDPEGGQSILQIISAPLIQLIGSAVVGGVAGLILILVTRRVVRPDRLATASLIAILITSGLADYWGLSSLLACLFLGVTLANVTPQKEEVGHAVFANFEAAFFAVFFTMAGMKLNFDYVLQGGLIALVMFVGRGAGKVGSGWIAMRIAGATRTVRRHLGLALLPQAGLAVGLMLLVEEDAILEPIQAIFLAAGLTVVLGNEIVGPILTRIALSRSGEVGKDRPRLIDFLHEENIVTGLEAETKEEAMGKLADLLIRTHHLETDRETLLKSVLEREAMGSTCVGEGLAIPHAIVEEGVEMSGVMGISGKGLPLETPDGIPVHCMVLLATPPSRKDHHLEVLAALARSIGSDRNIQRQLYHAESPAHAYDIIHAEEFEDFNYFLEE